LYVVCCGIVVCSGIIVTLSLFWLAGSSLAKSSVAKPKFFLGWLLAAISAAPGNSHSHQLPGRLHAELFRS